MRKVGFSVVFFDDCPDSFYEPILDDMFNGGMKAIELNFPEHHERVLSGTLLTSVRRFEYRAVHSQQLISPDESPEEVMRCNDIIRAVGAHALTVHPNSMSSFGWLDSTFGGLTEPENMDISKAFGAQPEDMSHVYQQLPKARMVVDTQHILTLGNKITTAEAAHALHSLGVPIGHYHLSGLGPELKHVGLDKVPEAQLDAQFSWLIDPNAPLIFETRGKVVEKDEHGVEHIRYDLTEWETDYKLADPYLKELANA